MGPKPRSVCLQGPCPSVSPAWLLENLPVTKSPQERTGSRGREFPTTGRWSREALLKEPGPMGTGAAEGAGAPLSCPVPLPASPTVPPAGRCAHLCPAQLSVSLGTSGAGCLRSPHSSDWRVSPSLPSHSPEKDQASHRVGMCGMKWPLTWEGILPDTPAHDSQAEPLPRAVGPINSMTIY